MSRRNQLLSVAIFSLVLYLAIIFGPQFKKNPLGVSNIRELGEYGQIVGIELGETSRVGVFHGEDFHSIATGQWGKPWVDIFSKRHHFYFNEEVTIEILKKLKTAAEEDLGLNITHAVITVPASFNDTLRELTKDAGTSAGLKVLRIINEPTAAGIGIGVDMGHDEQNVVVYNLNSDTFDVTLSTIDRGVFEILSSKRGDTGSEAYNQAVLEHIIGTLEMRKEVTRAENILSTKESAKITHHLKRNEIQEVYERTFNKTLPSIRKIFTEFKHNRWDNEIEEEHVHVIILTGDPVYAARIQPFIEVYFGKKAVIPNEAILRGAAKQAHVLMGEDGIDVCTMAFDINPLALGFGNGSLFRSVIPRHMVIPTRKSVTIMTDDQKGFKIDIAAGASPLIRKSELLGSLEISSYSKPRQIEIAFELDMNGILKVMARDGREEVKVVIEDVLFTKKYEMVEKLVMEAEENEKVDLIEKEKIEQEEVVRFWSVEGEFVRPKERKWFFW